MLGDPKAPLTVTEYVDLQCPVCAAASRETLPALVRDYVRTGKVKLEARTLHFIGPDSERAARVAAGAEQQGRLWPFLEAFYAAQGAENSGYVTDDFLRSVARGRRRRRRRRAEGRRTAPPAQERLEPGERRRAAARRRLDADVHRRPRRRRAARARRRRAGPRDARRRARRGAGAMSGRVRLASAVVAAVGLAIAGYLTVVHYAGGEPVCAIAHGCATVQQSDYAELAGIPVALLGLGGYVAILASLARDGRGAAHRDGVPRRSRASASRPG